MSSSLAVRQQMLAKDINALKRKFQETIPQFKSSSKSDVRIEAFMLKRMPAKIQTNPTKKAPPCSVRIMILKPDEVQLNATVVSDESTGNNIHPTQLTLKCGQVVWASIFDLPVEITDGSLFLINGGKCNEYNGKTSLSANSGTLISHATFQKLVELPYEAFMLPKDSYQSVENLVLPVGFFSESLKNKNKKTTAITWNYTGNQASDVYVNRKNGVTIAAYDKDVQGYPFIVRSYESETECYDVSVFLKLYDNQLSVFGIVDVTAWQEFAPLIFKYMKAVIVAYVNTNETERISYNVLEDKSESYNYVLRATASKIYPDLPCFLKEVGFKVNFDFALENAFEGEMFLDNGNSAKNPLYLNREKGNVVNLSEYMGKIKAYQNKDAWTIYVLVNYDESLESIEKLEKIRHELSNEEREQVLLGKHADFELNYSKLYVFALKN